MTDAFDLIFRKADYDFVDYHDLRLRFSGEWTERPDQRLIVGFGAGSTVSWLGSELNVLFMILHHPWSGVVARDSISSQTTDLYSFVPYADVVPAKALSLIGSRTASHGEELVVFGAFVPKGTMTHAMPAAVADTLTRENFETIQTDQVDRWAQAIVASGRSVDEVMLARRDAYLMRWRESEPYARNNSTILDIGCGHFLPGMIEYLSERNLQYTGLDIDERVISANIEKTNGLKNFHFVCTSNENLTFNSNTFDMIFSSHSIEHSADLRSTFQEVLRTLKPGGWFFFAVPLDVDLAPEHLWIMGPDVWELIPNQVGLLLRNRHIGNIYPEQGHDLVLVAQKPA